MKRLAFAVILGLTSLSAYAGVASPPTALPEPSALSLLAIGAVGGLVVWARNRKKK
ncbi:MAG: PEP-CTERM sorting domain-containing protein [Hyphomicrobiaceae bacterium]